MKTYLIALLCVCISSAVVRVISPDGVMKKYIEMLCAICIISVVIVPIYQEMSNIDSMGELFVPEGIADETDYDEIYNEYLSQKYIENTCDLLEADLAERLKIANEDIDVRLEVYENDVEVAVRSATVVLDTGAITADPEIIKEFFYERFAAECEIIYDNLS